MSDLTQDGTSTYQTGTNDTYTSVADNVDTVVEGHINGVCEATVQQQTIMGDGPTLKGSEADLATRLAVRHNADGTHKTQPVDEGGTGLTTYTIGDMVYATAATTLGVLNISTENKVLGTNVGATGPRWLTGLVTNGPPAVGTGSTVSTPADQLAWSGSQSAELYYFEDLNIQLADTVTLTAGNTIIYASKSITIVGTLTSAGQGQAGGAGAAGAVNGSADTDGSDQAGGGGGGGNATNGGDGGDADHPESGVVLQAGASGGTGPGDGSTATNRTGTAALKGMIDCLYRKGGAGGGGGGGAAAETGGNGGAGGGSITLIAPSITISGTVDTSGANGSNTSDPNSGGGGGGAAGNFYAICNTYGPSGATFTQTGGTGGTGGASAGDGGDGADGIRQIFIFS